MRKYQKIWRLPHYFGKREVKTLICMSLNLRIGPNEGHSDVVLSSMAEKSSNWREGFGCGKVHIYIFEVG